MTSHTVLLIEDDTTTRDRLALAVSSHPELELLAAVGSRTDALAVLAEKIPEVMLVDLGLPDGSGLDLIRHVVGLNAGVRIMVITIFDDEQHVVSAIEHGATGYLVKDSSAEHIGDAIMQLIAGGSPISPYVARYLLKRFQPTSPPVDAPSEKSELTKRECEILQLIAKGLTYAEVATALQLSTNTVAVHIKHIYRKLAVNSRGEAVFEAADRGIITLPR